MDYRKDYAFTADGLKAETHDEMFFSGATSFCRRKYVRDLDGVDVAVVGVPFDTSVTNRPGSRFGPRAVRTASTNLAWARAWPSSFDPFQRLAVGDWGDIHIEHGHPERTPALIEAAIRHIHDQGARTLLIGGDHFTSYPSLKAHVAREGRPLALVQFDAHTDTWKDDGTRIDHGTMFYHAVEEGLIDPAKSIQVGIRTTNDDPLGIEIRDAITVNDTPTAETVSAIRERVGNAPVYLTFDIDALDPSCAPGTGTPVIGGLSTHKAMSILRGLHGLNVVGCDMVEVSPAYDVGEITALAGATIALEMLCLYASAR